MIIGKSLLKYKEDEPDVVGSFSMNRDENLTVVANRKNISDKEVSDGTLWEGQIALYFRWTCLPDCAVLELDADYRRNNRRLS